MVTVSDITANSVTLRKVNTPGGISAGSHHSLASHSYHSFDDLEPLPLSPQEVIAGAALIHQRNDSNGMLSYGGFPWKYRLEYSLCAVLRYLP